MSESILKALVRLFAIIARVDDAESTKAERKVVRNFLKQQLSADLVSIYLSLYDEFLESHHKISDSAKSKKRTSLNSVKVLRICSEINGELLQRQKFIVLLRLIEFIHTDDHIGDQELEFVHTVAQSFNIEDAEFEAMMTFNGMQNSSAKSDETLLIASSQIAEANRRHLTVENLQGELMVLHLRSVGMFVMRYFGKQDLLLNGQGIAPEKVYLLGPGSSIRGPKISPIYYSDILGKFLTDSHEQQITFSANDITYHFRSGKQGLHPLNFSVDSGTLLGIMGGSGAGKSTVLNVLNGNEPPSAGAVTINGVNIHQQRNQIQGVIGYVSQDDLLIEELTVYENLFYNAKLCFGGMSDEDIHKRVMDTLSNIGLSDTLHLKVGNPMNKTISGGQRKRLNIALELIRQPTVLFVDEPTSGLSSRDSEMVMDLLKELALKGKLVFVVIHQPSSDIFKMFDKLLILDLGGYPIYYGNPVESLIYFKSLVNHVNAQESECGTCGNVNPEQIFNIIETKLLDDFGNQTAVRKVSPKEWNAFYREKLVTRTNSLAQREVPKGSFSIPGKLKQFQVFLTRDLKSKLTNRQYLIINFLETPLLAFILSFLVKYYNADVSNSHGYQFIENENLPAYILMGVVIALFVGMMVSAEEIIRDQRILKRETFLNLSRGSYLWSKVVILFGLSAIQTLTFVLIGNTILGIEGMYTDYWFVLFSVCCFANVLGLNISASFNSAVTIYILIPFLIIPQLILSGVIVKFEKLNPAITSQRTVPLVGELMTSRWAYEALAVNQFKSNAYEALLFDWDLAKSQSEYRKDRWIPKLIEKLDDALNRMAKGEPTSTLAIAADLKLIQMEIEGHNSYAALKFNGVERLEPTRFNQTTGSELRRYLTELKRFYNRKYLYATEQEDKIIARHQKTEAEKNSFQELKEHTVNDNLSSLVRNSNDLNQIVETPDGLVQHSDPIFHLPERTSFIRAHFFAPVKSVGGTYVDTYWVNLGMIWARIVFWLVALYFGWLPKLINGLSSSMLIRKLRKFLSR
jgi:ABC-type multidrug transport system ATPase subunit